jgi:hypothetical protein
MNPFEIESEKDYLQWLSSIEDKHAGIIVDRTHIKAKAGIDGALMLGVNLNTGDVFWKNYPTNTFDDFLANEINKGVTIEYLPPPDGISYVNTKSVFESRIAIHGEVLSIELYSSHVGDESIGIMADGTRMMLDFT